MRKGLIVIIFAFVVIGLIQAQFLSGNDLVEYMRDYEQLLQKNLPDLGPTSAGAGLFIGYVIGVVDATLHGIPVGTSRQQIGAVVVKYMNNHPELWARPASELVGKAVIEAFNLKLKRR